MVYQSQYELYKSQTTGGGMAVADFNKAYDAKIRSAKEAFPHADANFIRYQADRIFWKSHVPKKFGIFKGINPMTGRLSPVSKGEPDRIEKVVKRTPERSRRDRRRDRGRDRDRDHRPIDKYRPRSPHNTYRGRSPQRSEGRVPTGPKDARSRSPDRSPTRMSWVAQAKVIEKQIGGAGVTANGHSERLTHEKSGLEPSSTYYASSKRATCSDTDPFGAGALYSAPLAYRAHVNSQPQAVAAPSMLSRSVAPSQGRRYFPIPLATRDDELSYLKPFFASQNGWPRFCSVCAQSNAAVAFSLTAERRVALDREFPRLRFRTEPFPEGLLVWVEPALPPQADGFVLPEAYKEQLEMGAKLLRTYSRLAVPELPPIDVFVRDYFAGHFDEAI